MIFKKIIKKIFKFFGVNISRSSKDNYDVWPQSNFNSTTVYEDDVGFHKKYNSLLVKLNMKDTDIRGRSSGANVVVKLMLLYSARARAARLPVLQELCGP